ncbi:MAG: alpha/beta hydrolase fold domain-containing protein [Actinomycetes bacterium]
MREHGHEYDADPSVVFVAGSSAGGHLAAMAALTPNDPASQPGFEGADTFGQRGHLPLRLLRSARPTGRPAACLLTLAYVGSGAPPFFVAHGDRDTLVLVEGARRRGHVARGGSRGSDQSPPPLASTGTALEVLGRLPDTPLSQAGTRAGRGGPRAATRQPRCLSAYISASARASMVATLSPGR